MAMSWGLDVAPYVPFGQVSQSQYDAYIERVFADLGARKTCHPDRRYCDYGDIKTGIIISVPGHDHPAHPAWVVTLINNPLPGLKSVSSGGYYVRNKEAFDIFLDQIVGRRGQIMDQLK